MTSSAVASANVSSSNGSAPSSVPSTTVADGAGAGERQALGRRLEPGHGSERRKVDEVAPAAAAGVEDRSVAAQPELAHHLREHAPAPDVPPVPILDRVGLAFQVDLHRGGRD